MEQIRLYLADQMNLEQFEIWPIFIFTESESFRHCVWWTFSQWLTHFKNKIESDPDSSSESKSHFQNWVIVESDLDSVSTNTYSYF